MRRKNTMMNNTSKWGSRSEEEIERLEAEDREGKPKYYTPSGSRVSYWTYCLLKLIDVMTEIRRDDKNRDRANHEPYIPITGKPL
jgi:hypothetical protein